MNRRFVIIIVGVCILLMVAGGAIGIIQWQKYRRCEIGGGKIFQTRLPARPRMHPGLKAIMVDMVNTNASATEVTFRLRRAGLGRIGTTYRWDWESPTGSLSGKSWINQSMCVRQNGSVTAWDVEMDTAGTIRLKIWRDLGDRWVVTAQSELVAVVPGFNHFVLNPQLPVQSGDVVGFYSAKGGIKLNSALGIRLPGELHQNRYHYDNSVCREIEYVVPGDASVAMKTETNSGPHPGFAFRIEMSSSIVPDAIGSLEEPALGGVETSALSVIDLEKVVPRSGSLVAWEVMTRSAGQVRLKVWRREQTLWRVIAESPLESAKAGGLNRFSLNPPLEVRQNDYLGYYTDQTAGELSKHAGVNFGKLYVAGDDVRGPVEESGMFRDTVGNYLFRAVFSPMEPAVEIIATAHVKPGRFIYRFELPDQAYALDEQVELLLEAGGSHAVFLYPGLRHVLKGGNSFVGLDYDTQSTVSFARIVPFFPNWPVGDVLLLTIGIIGVWGMCRPASGMLRLVLVGLTPAAAFLAWNQVIPAGILSRIVPCLVSLGLIPGFIIMELAFPKMARKLEDLERVPLQFGFSCGLWTVLALFAYRMQWSSDCVIGGVLLADVAGLLAILVMRWTITEHDIDISQVSLPYQAAGKAALLLMITVFALVVGYNSQYQRNDFDTFLHLAGCHRIAEGLQIIGGEAMLGPSHGALPHYAANPWYLVFGLTARAAHVDVTCLYVVLAAGLTALFILVFYSVLKFLLRDPRAAIIGALLGIIPWFYNWTTEWSLIFPIFLPYPGTLTGVILFPLLTIYALQMLVSGNKETWFAVVFLAVTAMGQHICFVIWVPFLIGVVSLAGLLWPDCRRDRLKALALMIGVCLSAVVIGYLTVSFPLVGKLKPESIEESLHVWRRQGGIIWQLGRNWFAVSPVCLLEQGWKDLLGLAVIVLFIRYGIRLLVRIRAQGGIAALTFSSQRQTAPMRLYAGVAAIILCTWGVVFNPILVPWLIRLLHSSIPVYRLEGINLVLSKALFFGAIACLISLPLISSSWNKCRPLMWIIPLGMLLLIAAIPLRSLILRTMLIESLDNRVWHPSILDLPNETLYRGLYRLPPGAVAVRTDFGEITAALTPHTVLAIKVDRMGDYRIIGEHLSDNDKIVNFSIPPDVMRQLLAKHNCRYVIVPSGDPNIVRFEEHKTLFTEVLRTESYRVFEAKMIAEGR